MKLALMIVPMLALAACGGDDDAASSQEDWCATAEQIDADSVLADAFAGEDEARAALEEFQSLIDDAAEQAPDEILADVNTVADGTDRLVAILDDVDGDVADLDAGALDGLGSLGAEMTDASARIVEFNVRECGIEVVDDSGSGDGDVGDDGNDDGSDEDDDGDTGSGSIREQIVDQLVNAGFSNDEANCIVDAFDFSDSSIGEDLSAMFDVFDECGLDLGRLGDLGG